MTRKVLKKKFLKEEDEDEDEDEDEVEALMCPPQQIPSSNLSEEGASQKDWEDVAMEEGIYFEKKEEITGAEEEIGTESPDMSGGQRVVSPSRRPDVGPGAETVNTGVHHPVVGRRTRIQQRVLPGAVREGGPENEEEDEEDQYTIQSHTEPSIPPTVLAEPIDVEEEERRHQEDINRALQTALEREHQLAQDQINQALQREREQAVIAEAVPDVISKRDRRWEFAGAFLFLVLIVVGIVLGITLRPDTETDIPQDLTYLLSNASSDSGDALRNPSTPQYEALKWLAGDANLAAYTDQQKIQRYALATLHYSTKGDNWTRKDFWLSNADVCGKWYQFNDTTIDCTSVGSVVHLDLSNNNLVGKMPPEIGMLSSSLELLRLDSNDLGGKVPNEIALLKKLTSLSLWNNSLIGTLPSVIGLLTNLQELFLSLDGFTGTIPSEIGRLTKLESYLDLDDNSLTGTIPTTLGSLVLLEDLWLGFNALEGPIPTELAQCHNLKGVSFGRNTLTGDIGPVIDLFPRSLTVLDLSANRFSGTVPTFIGTFTDLNWLDLEGNYIDPASNNLNTYNNINGTIPTELGLLRNLELLNLASSHHTGTIPTSLASLSLLKYLFLYVNDLNGTIPTELGLLGNLDVLSLHTNQLSGTIPTSLGSLSRLKVGLSLYENFLNGTIPSELGLLSNLEALTLHSNQLTGTVPTSLASLPLLTQLSLFDNNLTSVEAFCDIATGNDFDVLAANTCGQFEIVCECCNVCCELVTLNCEPL